MTGRFRERLSAFLAAHTTMALATVGAEGRPAVAALFYAHDEALRLYYLSSPGAQHSLNIQNNPEVAAAIYADGQDWREIRGVQLRGHVRRVSLTALPRAVRVYGAKYDFVRALLKREMDGPVELIGPLARSRFYVLEPVWVRLTDNSVAFGHKEEADWEML